MIDVFFMSPPGPNWALRGRANFRSREAAPVDAAIARREWLALARHIEDRGGLVVVLPPPSDELTGTPYAAECGHMVGGRFVLPRMWAPHRRGERDHWARLLGELGVPVVDPVPADAFWEAQGDVAELDGATILFWGGRTDRRGLDAVRPLFEGEVLELPIREPAFHGNMAMLPLPALGQALVCPDVLVGDGMDRLVARFGRERLHAVTEDEIKRYATNGLPVGTTLLAPSVVPERVVGLCRSLGMTVTLLPMGELCEKAGGASRCLVSRARFDDAFAARVPEHSRLAATAREIEGGSPTLVSPEGGSPTLVSPEGGSPTRRAEGAR